LDWTGGHAWVIRLTLCLQTDQVKS